MNTALFGDFRVRGRSVGRSVGLPVCTFAAVVVVVVVGIKAKPKHNATQNNNNEQRGKEREIVWRWPCLPCVPLGCEIMIIIINYVCMYTYAFGQAS